MFARKPGLAALLIVVGFSVPALGQQKGAPGGATGSYPATQINGTGSTGYYAMYPGAINYGLSGTYPTVGGYGYAGFGPGPQFGAHYPATVAQPPQTYNNLGGLMNGIKKQTGKPGNTGSSPAKGPTRPRKGL